MTAAAPALQVRSLHRFFRVGTDETLAVQGVSFDVRIGELVVVAGPSGSGKTTLLRCLAGLDEPDGGQVTIDGETLTGRPEPDRARLRGRLLGLLFQTGNLFDHLTVAQNIALAQTVGERSGLRPTPEKLLTWVGLPHRAHFHPTMLSGGEAAQAGLAVALANDPAVLVADEPTGELDSAAEAVVLELLLAAADRGAAVVVASHSTAVTTRADRVLRMRDGRLTR